MADHDKKIFESTTPDSDSNSTSKADVALGLFNQAEQEGDVFDHIDDKGPSVEDRPSHYSSAVRVSLQLKDILAD